MYIQAQTQCFTPEKIQSTFERIYSDLDEDDFHIIVHNFAAHGYGNGIDPASFQDTYIKGIIPKVKQLIDEQGKVIIFRSAHEGTALKAEEEVNRQGKKRIFQDCFADDPDDLQPMTEEEFKNWVALDLYGWPLYKEYNRAAEEAIRSFAPEIIYLDVRELTIRFNQGMYNNYDKSRHDCLHPCLPGFPDVWYNIMANLIDLYYTYTSIGGSE